MDALTSLLHDVRSEGALFGRSILTPPWSIRVEDGVPLTLLTMLRGDAWITPDGAEPVRVTEGEAAIVAGGESYTVADVPHSPTTPLYVMVGPSRCRSADGAPFDVGLELGTRTYGERPDGPTALVMGNYQVRGRVSHRLLTALPRVLVVPHEGELCPVLELTAAEVARDAPGQQAVLDRLLDLLLLTTLRQWFARPEAEPPGWYRALGDPVVGPALRSMHADPAAPWTVAGLAARSAVSRATFARRFADLVGEPPMAYLTGWRLSVAADLLARSDATVEAVARQVGYAGAFALSVAFKRVHGTRPSALRGAPSPRPNGALVRS